MLSRSIRVVATVALAFLGVIGNPDQLWVWIVASLCVVIILLFEIMSYRRTQHGENRLGRNYEAILGKVLSLIADLSDLTAREFDLWVVDLYLPSHPSTMSLQTRIRKLELSLHIALTDVRTVRSEIDLDHQFFGRCFTECRSDIWWDVALTPTTEENRWGGLDCGDNHNIRTEYGVVSVNPVVNHLGRDCRGLLMVHARQDPETVTKVLSALRQSEGKRRIAAACIDIHNHLRAS